MSAREAVFRIALAHNIALRVAKGESQRNATKHALQELKGLVPDAIAGAIAVDKNSWSALQIGPAMPVAWIDDLGANESIGFRANASGSASRCLAVGEIRCCRSRRGRGGSTA